MGFLSSLAPLAGAAIGGLTGGPAGAALGGNLGGAFSSAQGVSDANKTNWDIATMNKDFTATQSNTAHQREVADLKAAGLNPMLSGMGGSGASTTQGASAVMQNEAPDYSHAISSGLEAKTATQNLENLKSQEKLTTQQIAKTTADAETAQTIARDTDLTQRAREGDLMTIGNNKGHAQVPSYYRNQNQAEQTEYNARSAEARRAQKTTKFQDDHNTLLNVLDTAQKGANVLSTGASILKPAINFNSGKSSEEKKNYYQVHKKTGEIK